MHVLLECAQEPCNVDILMTRNRATGPQGPGRMSCKSFAGCISTGNHHHLHGHIRCVPVSVALCEADSFELAAALALLWPNANQQMPVYMRMHDRTGAHPQVIHVADATRLRYLRVRSTATDRSVCLSWLAYGAPRTVTCCWSGQYRSHFIYRP